MASPGENTRNDFAMRFNSLMAQHGKSTRNDSDAYFSRTLPNLDQVIKAARNRQTNLGSSSNRSARTSGGATISQEEKEAFLAERDKEMKAEENDKPWYKDALDVGSQVLKKLDVPAAYARSGIKEIADSIETSRVGHWLYDVMDYDPAEDGRTPSSGSWSDFRRQAKDHMGFGEMWSDARGDDNNKWLDRGVGFVGDVLTDPLTYVGAGLVTRPASKLLSGASKLDGPVGKAAVKSVAKTTADDVANTLKGADEVFNKAAAESRALADYVAKHPRRVVSRGLRYGAIDEAEAIRRIKATHPQDFLVTGATGRQVIEDAVQAQVDKTVYEVQRRSQAGKLIGNPKEIQRNVAQHVTEAAKKVILRPLDEAVKVFQNAIKNGKPLTKTQIDDLAKDAPYFKEWADEVAHNLSFGKVTNPTPAQIDVAYRKAQDKVNDLLSPESNRIFAQALGSMKDSLERVPTLRMFGKQVAEFPTLGRVASKATKTWVNTPIGESAQKLFSYTSNFPGYSSLIAQKARALGVARYEAKRKEIIAVARQFDHKEAQELQRLLENGSTGIGKMADGLKFLRQAYDDILGEEMAAGVRNLNKSARVKDYAYTHIYRKRKTKHTIDKWNQERSLAAQSGSLAGYKNADAIAAGFVVEKDAFKNLLMRNMRANRKLTEAYFYRDLVSHYGFKGKVGNLEKGGERNLVRVAKEKNNDILQAMKATLDEGEELFIDADIKRIFDNYVKISKQPDEIIRGLDYLTRKFKIMNTIYFPGYHIRNIIGDYFMGLMDGVKTRDYATILNKWAQMNTASINIGGQTVKMQDFLSMYEKNLGSGAFLSGEIGNGLLSGRTPAAGIRKISEGREDLGRIVHFYRALDDEYRALLNKKIPKDKAWEEATNSAIFRVNKFKFDYGALTAGEMSIMRRGIPFYTYMRKAIPTLMESLLLNPKYLATMNRLVEGAEERYDDTLLPDWMRELGYGKLTDTFGMNFNMLPTNTINEMFANPVPKLNPLIQIPFEANSGEDSFTKRPLDNTGIEAIPQILANKWRGTNNLRDLAPTVKDATGITMPETFFGKDNIGLDSDKTTVEKWANFFGFPIKRVAEQERTQALTEIRYQLNGKMNEINEYMEKMGYKVYFSERNDGSSLRVRDETTGAMIFEASTLKELREFVTAKRNGDI